MENELNTVGIFILGKYCIKYTLHSSYSEIYISVQLEVTRLEQSIARTYAVSKPFAVAFLDT